MTIGGTLARIDAAAMSPHGTSYTPGNSASATGTVRLASVAVNVYAKSSSFHDMRNTSSAADATPGATSGTTTRASVVRRPAPSICAASSIAGGTARTNPATSQSSSGSANEVSANTSATHVSRSCSARMSTNSGPTIVTCGNAVQA